MNRIEYDRFKVLNSRYLGELVIDESNPFKYDTEISPGRI